MFRLFRHLRNDDRGAVVVETLLMFVLMITFIAATTRTMKVHANNQAAYMEAHRRAILYAMSPVDISYLAGQLDLLNSPPDVPTWTDEHLEEDLSGALADLSDHGNGFYPASKLVYGQESRTIKMFNTDAFGLSDNPADIKFQHAVHMMRGPWTFSGFPAAIGSDPFVEAQAVRDLMGAVTDEELVGFEIWGDPLREYLKMKPIWLKPLTFQEAGEGNY